MDTPTANGLDGVMVAETALSDVDGALYVGPAVSARPVR
jgi:hypothetical protein